MFRQNQNLAQHEVPHQSKFATNTSKSLTNWQPTFKTSASKTGGGYWKDRKLPADTSKDSESREPSFEIDEDIEDINDRLNYFLSLRSTLEDNSARFSKVVSMVNKKSKKAISSLKYKIKTKSNIHDPQGVIEEGLEMFGKLFDYVHEENDSYVQTVKNFGEEFNLKIVDMCSSLKLGRFSGSEPDSQSLNSLHNGEMREMEWDNVFQKFEYYFNEQDREKIEDSIRSSISTEISKRIQRQSSATIERFKSKVHRKLTEKFRSFTSTFLSNFSKRESKKITNLESKLGRIQHMIMRLETVMSLRHESTDLESIKNLNFELESQLQETKRQFSDLELEKERAASELQFVELRHRRILINEQKKVKSLQDKLRESNDLHQLKISELKEEFSQKLKEFQATFFQDYENEMLHKNSRSSSRFDELEMEKEVMKDRIIRFEIGTEELIAEKNLLLKEVEIAEETIEKLKKKLRENKNSVIKHFESKNIQTEHIKIPILSSSIKTMESGNQVSPLPKPQLENGSQTNDELPEIITVLKNKLIDQQLNQEESHSKLISTIESKSKFLLSKIGTLNLANISEINRHESKISTLSLKVKELARSIYDLRALKNLEIVRLQNLNEELKARGLMEQDKLIKSTDLKNSIALRDAHEKIVLLNQQLDDCHVKLERGENDLAKSIAQKNQLLEAIRIQFGEVFSYDDIIDKKLVESVKSQSRFIQLEYEKKTKDLLDQLDFSKSQNTRNQLKLSSLEEEIHEYKEKNEVISRLKDATEEKNREYQLSLDITQAKLKEYECSTNILTKTITSLKEEIETAHEENSKLFEVRLGMETLRNELLLQISTLNQQVSSLENTNLEIAKALNEEKIKKTDPKLEKQDSEGALKQKVQNLNKKLKNVSTLLEDEKSKKLKILEETKQNVEKEKILLTDQLNSSRSQIKEFVKELAYANTSIAMLQQEGSRLKKINADLIISSKEELNKINLKCNELESDLKSKDTSISALRSELESKDNTVLKLEAKISNLEAANNRLEVRIGQKELSLEGIEAELRTARSQLLSYEINGKDSNSLIEELKIKVDKKQKEIDELAKEIRLNEEALSSQKDDFKKLSSKSNDEIQRLEALTTSLTNKIAVLEQGIKDSQQKVVVLESELASKKDKDRLKLNIPNDSEISKLKQSNSNKDNLIEILREEISQLENKLDRLEQNQNADEVKVDVDHLKQLLVEEKSKVKKLQGKF